MTAKVNPFTPQQPIDPEFFAGRIDEVRKISAALNQTSHGKTQHVMLTGERGIGKSSLALYGRYMAETPNEELDRDFKFATAYYTVEKNQDLVDVCRGLTSALLDNIERGLAKKCFEQIMKLGLHFSLHIPGLGEVSTSTAHGEQTEAYLQADFVKTVKELWNEIKETHNGVLLIVDEIHNLRDLSGLGSFLKVISETWTVSDYRHLMFIVVGLPHIPNRISEDDPSAPRIFSYVELKKLTQAESLAILHRCLEDTEKEIKDDAARQIAVRSGGFPYFLHQLAYDAFQADTDDVIDSNDAANGFMKSLVQFERMFFGKMYKSVEGKQKQKIVDELARRFNAPMKASELGRTLSIKNIHQYLKPLETDGILERVKDKFRLSTDLLATYIMLFKDIQSQEFEEAEEFEEPQEPEEPTL